eukprot:1139927-Pelagomonas_calceolata.AAC.15
MVTSNTRSRQANENITTTKTSMNGPHASSYIILLNVICRNLCDSSQERCEDTASFFPRDAVNYLQQVLTTGKLR